MPIFPFWTLEALPGGPRPDAPVPPPTAAAVLVAKGYLVAPMAGMGRVANDPLTDPAVFVFDGKDWHAGRYVDYDKGFELALIRADVPGAPIAVRMDGEAERIAGLRPLPGAAIRLTWSPAATCAGTAPAYVLERAGTICFGGAVTALSGGAVLDGEGRLVGMQVERPGFPVHSGPDGREIKEFFDLYFASWGRDVRPKPTL